MKVFSPMVAIFSAIPVLLVFISPASKAWALGMNVFAAFLGFSAVLWMTADRVSARVRESLVWGAFYGMGLLLSWGIAFSASSWIWLSDGDFKQCLLVPLFWICFYGWSIAAFSGVLFSGGCRKLLA